MGTKLVGDQFFEDHLSMGTEFDGDHLPRRINLMGIVCPGGQEVGGPEVRRSNGFGTKCVAAIVKCNLNHVFVYFSSQNVSPSL